MFDKYEIQIGKVLDGSNLQLTRATIQADPIDEPAFAIREIIELKRCKHTREFSPELVRL